MGEDGVSRPTDPKGNAEPAVELEPKKTNRAQEVRDLLGQLEQRGVTGVAGLWTDRLEQTLSGKRPNTARQVGQLKKLLKGLGNGRSAEDVEALIRMTGEGGWSGIKWSYLDDGRPGARAGKKRGVPVTKANAATQALRLARAQGESR